METILITLVSVGVIAVLVLLVERRHQNQKRPPGKLFQKDGLED